MPLLVMTIIPLSAAASICWEMADEEEAITPI
jgi:hypothetical protein